jgi:hypothetical protein
MSKLIQLTQGKVAIVDDEDFEELNKFRWYCDRKYAVRDITSQGIRDRVYMHRLIANAPDHLEVDHINGDGADNRKENLRLCTHAENSRNRRAQKNNTTKYKGVWFSKRDNRFVAETRLNGKKITIGFFKTAEEASEAYKAKVLEIHGAFANTNNEIHLVNPVRDELKDVAPERNNDPKGSSGYFGVSESGYGNRFYVHIRIKGKSVKVGSFLSLHEAALAYNAKAIELFGDKANLNVIKEGEKDIVFESKLKESYAIKGYRGISYTKNRKRFFVQFRGIYWDVFDTIAEAALAYNKKAKEILGDKAFQNPIPTNDIN